MNLIIDRFHDERCVPFLGAAANVKSDKFQYDGLPLGADVASALLEEMPDLKGKDPIDLARISLHYAFEADRPSLLKRLREILPDD